ncbi:MAG: phosphoribosylglycinamide formyltransferase [Fervidobacterium sp.]
MHGVLQSGLPKIVVCASGSGSNFEKLAQSCNEGKLKAKISALIVDRTCYAINRAYKFSIPVVKLEKPWDAYFERVIDDINPDLIVLAGFMRIIPQRLVDKYFPKIVNIHPSLLPSFPGKDAIKQVYNYGVKVTGITIHFVDAGVDTGPIIFQKALDVQDNWNLEELEEHIHKLEHEYYWQIIDKLLHTPFKIKGRKVEFVGGISDER